MLRKTPNKLDNVLSSYICKITIKEKLNDDQTEAASRLHKFPSTTSEPGNTRFIFSFSISS